MPLSNTKALKWSSIYFTCQTQGKITRLAATYLWLSAVTFPCHCSCIDSQHVVAAVTFLPDYCSQLWHTIDDSISQKSIKREIIPELVTPVFFGKVLVSSSLGTSFHFNFHLLACLVFLCLLHNRRWIKAEFNLHLGIKHHWWLLQVGSNRGVFIKVQKKENFAISLFNACPSEYSVTSVLERKYIYFSAVGRIVVE